MDAHDQARLKPLAEALAEALVEIPLPPGELSVRLFIDKNLSGDREVSVIFQDRPRQYCRVKRRDPNPIEGHQLASLSFMREKRSAI